MNWNLVLLLFMVFILRVFADLIFCAEIVFTLFKIIWKNGTMQFVSPPRAFKTTIFTIVDLVHTLQVKRLSNFHEILHKCVFEVCDDLQTFGLYQIRAEGMAFNKSVVITPKLCCKSNCPTDFFMKFCLNVYLVRMMTPIVVARSDRAYGIPLTLSYGYGSRFLILDRLRNTLKLSFSNSF